VRAIHFSLGNPLLPVHFEEGDSAFSQGTKTPEPQSTAIDYAVSGQQTFDDWFHSLCSRMARAIRVAVDSRHVPTRLRWAVSNGRPYRDHHSATLDSNELS